MTTRNPGEGQGGQGTASEFGSLDGWTLEEAETYLNSHPDLRKVTITPAGYHWYVFNDTSEVYIRPDGEVIRIPKRRYNPDGSRITGYRLNIYTGEALRRDAWHQLPRDKQEWVEI